MSSDSHEHGPHHKHCNEVGDGNRALWRTHDADGRLRPDRVNGHTRFAVAADISPSLRSSLEAVTRAS